MADDIDAMLQGQTDQDPASQAQTDDQLDGGGQQQPQPTLEEVEFNKLTGSTQDRIRRLVKDKREALQRAEQLESMTRSVPPPPPNYASTSPEVQDAVRRLSDVGIATKDQVKAEINETIAGLRFENEMQRLESAYKGSKGEPQFVREEYEDYVRTHPQYSNYAPEDVFRFKMFRDEFLNMELSGRQSSFSGDVNTLRPTRTSVHKESLTPETIEEKLSTLKGSARQQWYDDHKDEINEVLGRQNPNQ